MASSIFSPIASNTQQLITQFSQKKKNSTFKKNILNFVEKYFPSPWEKSPHKKREPWPYKIHVPSHRQQRISIWSFLWIHRQICAKITSFSNPQLPNSPPSPLYIYIKKLYQITLSFVMLFILGGEVITCQRTIFHENVRRRVRLCFIL